jgi:hypothetical protein
MNSDMNDYNGSPDPGKPLEKFPERENLRVLEFGDMEFGDRRGIWGQTWNLGTDVEFGDMEFGDRRGVPLF